MAMERRGSTVHRRRLGVPPAFRYPKYRAYWLGFFLSVTGHQIFQFAQFVLVHELTGSVVALGFLGVANAVPAITLGVIGGVYADRWDKRKLIVFTQATIGITVLAVAVLTSTRQVEVWHVGVAALIVSGIGAFDAPARSAYYPRLIHPSAMISAVALNSTIWQVTRIIGPALTALIVANVSGDALEGISVALYVASLGAVAMIGVMLWLRVSGAGEAKGNPFRNLADGLGYIRSNPTVAALLLLAFAVAFFGWAFVILMPVFATEIIGVGIDGQGLLLASAGVGSTAVTVLLAVVDAPLFQRRGLFVVGGAASFGILLVGYALTAELIGSYVLAVVLIFGLGVTQMIYTTGTMGSIQLSIPNQVRGRVLGVYGIVWGMQPLSGTQAAFLSGFIGVSGAVAVGGGAIVALAIVAAVAVPGLRTLRIEPTPEDLLFR
jgi:MFS family permease